MTGRGQIGMTGTERDHSWIRNPHLRDYLQVTIPLNQPTRADNHTIKYAIVLQRCTLTVMTASKDHHAVYLTLGL